jgi:conjugal transfer pilus assembly protein TraB
LRGIVTDRQGSRLGKALLAGFAQGLSGALGQAQGTLSSSVLGTTNSIGGSDALRASGLSGAQAAASQLAQWYLKEAQSIFPVISVDAGRTGTIVFTNSASLTWGSGEAQFQKDVRPE